MGIIEENTRIEEYTRGRRVYLGGNKRVTVDPNASSHPTHKGAMAGELKRLCFGAAASFFDGTDKAYAAISQAGAKTLASAFNNPGPGETVTFSQRVPKEHVVVDFGSGDGSFLVAFCSELRALGFRVRKAQGYECVKERRDLCCASLPQLLTNAGVTDLSVSVELADIAHLTSLASGASIAVAFGLTFVDDEYSNLEALCRSCSTMSMVAVDCRHEDYFVPENGWTLIWKGRIASSVPSTFCVFRIDAHDRECNEFDGANTDLDLTSPQTGPAGAAATPRMQRTKPSIHDTKPDNDNDGRDKLLPEDEFDGLSTSLSASISKTDTMTINNPVIDALTKMDYKHLPNESIIRNTKWSSPRNARHMSLALSTWRGESIQYLSLSKRERALKLSEWLRQFNQTSDPTLPKIKRQTLLDRLKRRDDDTTVFTGRPPLLQRSTQEAIADSLRRFDRKSMGKPVGFVIEDVLQSRFGFSRKQANNFYW
mgnify:CR=1 FL=1